MSNNFQKKKKKIIIIVVVVGCGRKKPRTMAEAPVTPDWSSLLRDLLMVIAQFTLRASVEDFIAFGGVCKSWRAVGRDDEFVKCIKLSWPRVPFLMLAEKEGQKERKFFSISRRKIFMRIPMPEATGNRCIESRFGWLFTQASSPDNEGDVQLLNPFSGARIPLPSFKTFPTFVDYMNDPNRRNPCFDFVTHSLLSANPSLTSDFVLLVLLIEPHLAFWRNGDNHWTLIRNPLHVSCVALNYSNRDRAFYALSGRGHFCVLDAAAGADPPLLKVIHSINTSQFPLNIWGAYLVESSSGELLLVVRDGQVAMRFDRISYGATQFRVYQVDITRGELKRVRCLKDDAIFVGQNAAISIKVQPNDAIKSNCIYFSDDAVAAYCRRSPYRVKLFSSDSESDNDEEDQHGGGNDYWKGWGGYGSGTFDAKGGGGKDMGIYSLEDGSIQRFDHPHVDTLSFICPPLWIAPSSFSWRLC